MHDVWQCHWHKRDGKLTGTYYSIYPGTQDEFNAKIAEFEDIDDQQRAEMRIIECEVQVPLNYDIRIRVERIARLLLWFRLPNILYDLYYVFLKVF